MASTQSVEMVATSSSTRNVNRQQQKYNFWDLPKIFWRITAYCSDTTILNLMRVSQRFSVLATHDNVWRDILFRYNLQALIAFPIRKPLYRYFIEDIITTKALHGRYEFEAHSVGGMTDRFSPYNISLAVFIASTASLGNQWHTIGRGQLMITYRSGNVEVLQGALRFSSVRKCLIFCSGIFGSPLRGPVFTIAVAQVKRKWANQSQASLAAHQGGIRLVMTPVLVEGKTKGSLITETDVIAVSRPPPDTAAVAAAVTARAVVDN